MHMSCLVIHVLEDPLQQCFRAKMTQSSTHFKNSYTVGATLHCEGTSVNVYTDSFLAKVENAATTLSSAVLLKCKFQSCALTDEPRSILIHNLRHITNMNHDRIILICISRPSTGHTRLQFHCFTSQTGFRGEENNSRSLASLSS